MKMNGFLNFIVYMNAFSNFIVYERMNGKMSKKQEPVTTQRTMDVNPRFGTHKCVPYAHAGRRPIQHPAKCLFTAAVPVEGPRSCGFTVQGS